MTRLTEALERAQARTDGIPVAAESPEEALRDVPEGWQFDLDTAFERHESPAPPAPAAPPAARPAPAAVVDEAPRPIPPSVVDAPASAFAGDEPSEKLVIGRHDSLLIEQFRRLAAVLHHAQIQRKTRSVMIASAVPSEGKSLTATNLALTLSRSYEKRVLLIDTDLRRPTLHTLFNVPNHVGLTTTLNDPEQAPLPVVQVQQNLWLLPAGRPDPNPTSLVTSAAMRQILTEAMTQFDWVILDTPPVGLMPDANLLAEMIDAAFVVVNAGRTPYPLVKKAVDAIGLDRVLGIVLNRAERSSSSGAYSYGYHDYYADESQKADSGRKRFALG